MKKKDSKKKLIIIIASLIVVALVIAVGYSIYYRNNQVKLLNQEITLMLEKDLLNDDYTIKTKTSGDYAYVEERIKTYYKELSDNIKLIYAYLNDEALIKILSADNMANDGPNFETSYQTLNTTRENTDTAMNTIIELCSEEKIKSYIDKEKVSDYYYNLYLDYMYTEEELADLAATQNEIQEINTNLSIFLDKVEAILNMLKTNKDYWYIEDGILYFETNKLVDEYNTLYNDLNTFVTNNFSKYTNN